MVPIVIGFLASLVGLGGIGEKIRAIVETLQKPVTKALDYVIKTGLKLAGPIIRGIKGISGKVKAKVAAGKAWVKGKVQGGDDSPEGKQKRLDKGMAAALAAKNRFAGRTVGEKLLKPLLAVVRVKYGLTSLTVVDEGGRWTVVGARDPGRRSATVRDPRRPRCATEGPAVVPEQDQERPQRLPGTTTASRRGCPPTPPCGRRSGTSSTG